MKARASTGPRPVHTILITGALLLSGCSLAAKESRPDPKAENVRCALEYRPLADGSGADLLFLAWTSPYRTENFALSLPDNLLHMVAAPGRRLKKDARVTGATCSGLSWTRGFRLPQRPSAKKVLLCRRQRLELVVFEVETRWGVCTRRLAAGVTFPQRPVGLPEGIGLSSVGRENG